MAGERALGTVMCEAAWLSGLLPLVRSEAAAASLAAKAASASAPALPGSLGEGVHRSGLAVWASRVSKGKNRRFGRPAEHSERWCQYGLMIVVLMMKTTKANE